jgi:hypothetical protein
MRPDSRSVETNAFGGSAAYAVGEAFRCSVGLERKAKEAKAFYLTIAYG